MLDTVQGHRASLARDGLARRDFLRVGSLGLAGFSLPSLLRSEVRAAESSSLSAPRAKSVVLVFLGGGLSHLDSFDPKPDAPAEIRGCYSPIRTALPGVRVCEKLPRLARLMDRLTLIRSASHDCDHHETAANWVLSGRSGSPFGDYPAMGAVLAHMSRDRGVVPPYVAVPRNPAFTWEVGKSAFLGARCESFAAGDANASDGVLSPAARRAFAIEREPDPVRDRYGRTAAGQSMLLARRLVEAGVRFVTVSHGGWDHHAQIFQNLDRKLPEFDRALSALVDDLDDRGLLHETLLVVMGEFGRSPRLNRDGGRDHWCAAASLLVAGAGAKRGFVHGATDRQGASVADRPISPADVACTIYSALGIDPRMQLRLPDGRPIPVLDDGETIKELF